MTDVRQPFDPQQLTGEASLQRVVIGALPGIAGDIAGKAAADVCSRDALARLIAGVSGLPAPEPDRLGDQLAGLRSSPDSTTQNLAAQVLRAFGARLGALLATLKHPGTPAGQGGTPARRAYLEYWLGIERVWLGGGLLARGAVNDVLVGVQETLARTGTVLDVRVARSPAVLPLIGAARLVEPEEGLALVVDAGHTSIKGAIAVVEGGGLVALETLPARPAPVGDGRQKVEAALVTALAAFAEMMPSRPRGHRRVVMSVASYLHDGAPVDDDRSIYSGLVRECVGRLYAAMTGEGLQLEFVHDGTASAAGIADPSPSAVVTVGTWLGIGFTPAGRPLLAGDPVIRGHAAPS